jgi:drug/metabolite transporter (DMT)-like permease
MRHLQEHQKGILAIIASAILWSSGGIFIKLITLNTIQLASIRSAFAALVFGFIFRKKLLEVNGFTFVNALFYSGILIFFVTATKLTTAANAIFLQYTAPIYVLIFEPMINKTRYEKINIITVALCFAGMLLFFIGEISPGHFAGNIYALLSGIAFAAFLVGMRKNKNDYQFSSIFYGNVFIALIGIPSITQLQSISFSDLWMVAFLGIFQIGIAYVIFGFGLKRVLAIEASLIGMIEPVLNPVWVFIGYGETPSVMAITGGIIIIAVIAVRAFILESPGYKAVKEKNSLS